MDESLSDGVFVTPQKIIEVAGGDVYHAMKRGDTGFAGFGEAYFSTIEHGIIKAWKRHREMTLNLVVPVGAIRFVIYDNRNGSADSDRYQEILLFRDNYCRLTVPPMVWLGFQGVSEDTAMLLNIASIPHKPQEVDRKSLDEIKFDWRLN